MRIVPRPDMRSRGAVTRTGTQLSGMGNRCPRTCIPEMGAGMASKFVWEGVEDEDGNGQEAAGNDWYTDCGVWSMEAEEKVEAWVCAEGVVRAREGSSFRLRESGFCSFFKLLMLWDRRRCSRTRSATART